MIKHIIFVLIGMMLLAAPQGQTGSRYAIDAHWETLLPSRPWFSLRILRLCQKDSGFTVIT